MGRHVTTPHLLLRARSYYFRVKVPQNLVSVFGRREYKKSLGTGDFKAAKRLCHCYSLFAERYFNFVMMMRPSPDNVLFLIRNHFEKCLMDAEYAIWLAHEAVRDEGEGLLDIQAALVSLNARQNTLKETAMTHEYGPQQEKAAQELLAWQGWELKPLDGLFKDLARGITDAQLEAGRMHMAYLERDTKGMGIHADIFKPCHNYLQTPDVHALLGNETKPYHGTVTPCVEGGENTLTLDAAVDMYAQYKQRENDDWHRSRAAYFSRLKDILGANTSMTDLTEKDGFALEESLWRIPANYTKLYKDTALTEFLNGQYGDYEPIGTTTAKMYWQAIKAFFKWCERKKYTDGDILANVPLNVARTGAKEDSYKLFTPEQLAVFFKSPMYTGHKYANQRYWEAGDHLTKNGNYWIPLVGLFAGLRLGEILYLQIKDIKDDKGVAYIDVNKEEGKSLKTFQSARRIPVHPTLQAIGFLNYCEKRRKESDENDRLFDGISYPANQKITKNYSRNFGKLLKNIGVKNSRQQAFYSFRHNYVSALRRLGVSAEVMDPLDGRETTRKERGSRSRYGDNLTPHELYDHVASMDLKVDLSHLSTEVHKHE